MTETKSQAPCDCAETAERMGRDLEFFCWMFSCDVCVDAKVNCGRPPAYGALARAEALAAGDPGWMDAKVWPPRDLA